MRRLLVAVDGTRASHQAVRVALDYAARLEARLTLLHVLPRRVGGQGGEAPDFAAFEGACEDYAHRLVREVLGQAGAARAEALVLHGDPVDTLLEAALAEDVDLVIVGTRARGPLARTLLGSVSAQLLTRCPKPLLVVPERHLLAQESASPG